MKYLLRLSASLCIGIFLGCISQITQAQNVQPAPEAPAKNLKDVFTPGPRLTITNPHGDVAHIFPTAAVAAAREAALTAAGLATGPMTYHAGGSIMSPTVDIYTIFWTPAALQNGKATVMSAAYRAIQVRLAIFYNSHGIGNITTQYYQNYLNQTTYISNTGKFSGNYIDKSAYPASGCTDTATPKNCLSDAQMQTEIQKVMGIGGWTGGLNKVFLLFTSSGEGSCFNSSNCAYTQYCGYHSFVNVEGTPTIYAIIPYGGHTGCKITLSPNNDQAADSAANIVSHEIAEAATDPLQNAWYDTNTAGEIGDVCLNQFGTSTWNSGTANQMWGGYFYELQMEYSNHSSSCVQVGP